MMAAYNSGDPYIAFGIDAGILPPDATKATHPDKRAMLKMCVLGIQYGMGPELLAARMGQPVIAAREMLFLNRQTYRRFWKFSSDAVNHALLRGWLNTVFGWCVHVGENFNPRSLGNFVIQANGAEMLRLACCLAVERGVEICAPVHDAVLICAPLDRIEHDVAVMRAVMADASRAVLAGFEVRTDVSITRYPDRYADQRGTVMWARATQLLAGFDNVVAGVA